MCHVFLHKPNLPLAVRHVYVLFVVLQMPLEALEGFFDSKNGFLIIQDHTKVGRTDL